MTMPMGKKGSMVLSSFNNEENVYTLVDFLFIAGPTEANFDDPIEKLKSLQEKQLKESFRVEQTQPSPISSTNSSKKKGNVSVLTPVSSDSSGITVTERVEPQLLYLSHPDPESESLPIFCFPR
jgi:hypothetical protein